MSNDPYEQLYKTLQKSVTGNQIFPFPEIVQEGEWDVRALPTWMGTGKGYVSIRERAMYVPTKDDAKAARVRAHEMAHARWTPVDAVRQTVNRQIPIKAMQACEDLRLHTRLREAGIDLSERVWTYDRDYTLFRVDAETAAQEWVAYIGTGDEESIVRSLSKRPDFREIEKTVNKVRGKLEKPRAQFRSVLSAAKMIHTELGNPPQESPKPSKQEGAPGEPDKNSEGQPQPSSGGGAPPSAGRQEPKDSGKEKRERPKKAGRRDEYGEYVPPEIPNPAEGASYEAHYVEAKAQYMAEVQGQTGDGEVGDIPERLKKQMDPNQMYGEGQLEELESHWADTMSRKEKSQKHRPEDYQPKPNTWAEMHMSPKPLTRSLPVRLRGRKTRSAAEGAIPRSMHRLPIDQQVFARKVPQPQGSVLIDTSGSMSLSIEEVEEMMEKMPAGIIATYRGKGAKGYLRIVAKDGKRVESADLIPNDMCGGGNQIDGPALEWLGKQPMPRFWISDGCVVGRHGQTYDVLRDSRRLMRLHKIIRIDTAEELNLMARKFTTRG